METQKKYAQIINAETKVCNVGLGTNAAFYKSIGMELMDVEKAWDGHWYLKGYAPKKPVPPEPTISEKVKALESKYEMTRWQREGILNTPKSYSDLTLKRAQEIEDLAIKLRTEEIAE